MTIMLQGYDQPGSVRSDQIGVPSTCQGGDIVTVTGTQTLTNKTLTSPTITGATITTPTLSATNATLTTPTMTLSVGTFAGAGTTIADANAITTASPGIVLVTGGNNSVGVKLPATAVGLWYIIKNADAANGILKVYPAVNSTINALSANSSLDMAAKTSMLIVAHNATAWYSVSLLPS